MAHQSKQRKTSRQYASYAPEILKKTVNKIRVRQLTLNAASKKYNIPKSTLSRKTRNLNPNSYGRPKALNEIETMYLREEILEFAKWGCPLTRVDVQVLVKNYLDEKCKTESRFTNNTPSAAWIKHFIESDPVLSERLVQNINRSRASVSAEMINEYFDNLEATLRDVETY